MRAGGFPGNPGGLVVSIVKTAGARAPAHHARGRGRRTWRPTERSRRCSDGTAGRRQRSAGGWTARSRSVSEYRRSGGIEPTRPRGGKGAPAGGTVGGKDGQHTEVGSRLHVTTTDSRTGQISLGDGGGHRLASWTSGYATARSEAVCRGAGCGRTRTSGSVGGQGQQRTRGALVPGSLLTLHCRDNFACRTHLPWREAGALEEGIGKYSRDAAGYRAPSTQGLQRDPPAGTGDNLQGPGVRGTTEAPGGTWSA